MALILDGTNTPTLGGVGYGDGTELAFTAAGTSGQVLTSAGGAAPTWATPTQTFSLISTATASASSVIDFIFSGSYTNYQIIAANVVSSVSNTILQCQFSTDNGVSFDSTAGNYHWEYSTMLGAATPSVTYQGGIASQTEMRLLGMGINTANAGGTNFVSNIPNPLNASFTSVYLIGNSTRTGATQQQFYNALGTRIVTTGVVNAIRFFPNSGTFTSGSFKLYGIS